MSSLRKDLSSISTLSDENFKKTTEVASGNGSASAEWILHIDSLGEEDREGSLALFRLLNYIGDAFADSRDFDKEASDLDALISRLAEPSDNAKTGWERIKKAYPTLQSFIISKKEEAIKSRFSRVSELSVTVDARPIYSLDRSSIKNMLFPFILKIDTCDEKSVLCELYQEQIELLEEEIKLAKQKQRLLKEAINFRDE